MTDLELRPDCTRCPGLCCVAPVFTVSADLRGADLSSALFLTHLQVEAASCDVSTRLPEEVRRPAHWGR